MTSTNKKKKAASKKRIWLKVPATSKDRLEKIYDKLQNCTRTDILIKLIEEENKNYNNRIVSDPTGIEIEEQNKFVNAYILEHFKGKPEDEEFAQSEALKAYFKLRGYNFNYEGKEEFILPVTPDSKQTEKNKP